MKILYLAVEHRDINALGKADSLYRAMLIRGSTYTEKEFCRWAVRVFNAKPNSSLAEMAKACEKGGWRIIQMIFF